MKFILLLFILPACLPVPAAERAFYLWQRSWTPETELAVRACDRPLSAFAAELSRDKTERSAAPAEFWRRPGVTAVFRLRLDAFSTEGFRAACCRNRPERLPPGPARRRYTRAAAGGICGPPEGTAGSASRSVREFSITALPCHLPHARLRRRRPGRPTITCFSCTDSTCRGASKNRMRWLDPVVARTAIVRARKLGRPFRLALPTYAYRLSFAPGHRSFRRHQCGGRRSAGGTLEQSSGRPGPGAAPRSPAGKSGSASHLVPASGPRRSAQLRPGNDRTTRNGSHPGRAARYRAAADRAERGRAPSHAPRPNSA